MMGIEKEEEWHFMWTDTEDDSLEGITAKCATLAAIPALSMLLGGLTVLSPTAPPRRLVYAMQHFAAGMLLCSIAQELMPALSNAKTFRSLIGLMVGFSLGVGLMIGLEAFVGEHDGEPENTTDVMLLPGENAGQREEEVEALLASERGGGGGAPPGEATRTPSAPAALDRRTSAEGDGAGREKASSAVKRAYTIRERRLTAEAVPAFPTVFAAAVYVDSVMDGLLIGVTIIAGSRAGLMMAIALCVEMGFLGITFAQSVAPQPRGKALVAVAVGPACLLVGALLGGLLTSTLSSDPAALVGCTAFGVSALLYMVCEELLVSAHEAGEDHIWWIDLQVYVGFLFSLLLDKAFDLFPAPPP